MPFVLLFITAVTSLLMLGCDKPVAPPAPPRPALVVSVGQHTTPAPTVLSGEVRSRYESAQGFRIDGKLLERYVERGNSVKKGQRIARLDRIDSDLNDQAAQAEIAAAAAEQALAKAELNRHQRLFEQHFVSAQALAIQAARLQTAEARWQQAKAQAAVISNQGRYTDLLAERDGVITDINAEPGQVVAAGEPIVRIAMPNHLEVLLAVPESQRAALHLNSPAEVRLWSQPAQVYQATVREIAPAADSRTRTFAVRVAFSQANAAVQLGMTAGVRFYHPNDGDWLLPSPAVSQRDGQSVVWVVDSAGVVQPRAVESGAFREDGVLIHAGLQAGEHVVIAGVQALVPGQVVQAVPTEPRL